MNLAKPVASELVKCIPPVLRIKAIMSYEQAVYRLTQRHMGISGKRSKDATDGIDIESDIIDGAIQHTVAKVGLETLKRVMHASKDELCAYVLHVATLIYMKLNNLKEYHTIGGPELGLWALISNKERPTEGKAYIPVELSLPIADYVNDPGNNFHGFYVFGAEDTFAPKRYGE